MNWKKVRTAILSGMLAASLAAAGPSELLRMGNTGTVAYAEEGAEEHVIDRSLMTASADSYESGNEPAKALDGNSSTWWHTSWSNRKELPQSITLTLQEPVDGVCQLRYTPRNDKDWNGTILEYKISVSTDGETFTDAAAGTWAATRDQKTATFDSVNQVKAVRLTGITSKGNLESTDSVYVSAAEIQLVSRDSFVKNKEPLEELVEKGERLTADSPEGKQTLLKQLLEEAKEALSDPLTVQERFDELAAELSAAVETKTSFTGYAGQWMFDTNGERIQAHGGRGGCRQAGGPLPLPKGKEAALLRGLFRIREGNGKRHESLPGCGRNGLYPLCQRGKRHALHLQAESGVYGSGCIGRGGGRP